MAKVKKPSSNINQPTISVAGGDKLTTNTQMQEIARQIAREELSKEAKDIRKDFVTIFGLFAGFLTFTVLQIQSLIQQTRMSLIMGASSFFVAVTMTFVLGLNNVVKDRGSYKDFLQPVFIATILIFFFSFQCFWYATHKGDIWWFG